METEYFRRAIEYYADEANWKGGQTRLSEFKTVSINLNKT